MLTEYNVLQQQNMFDLVIEFYNDLDQTYAFILANPNLGNIDFDFSNFSNVVVKYDADYIKNTPAEIPTVQKNAPSKIKAIRGIEVQNIYDLCGMTYGSFDNMYKLIQDNGFDSINSTNVSGKSLVYDANLVVDNMLYDHINSNAIVFATGTITNEPIYITSQTWKDVAGNYWKVTVDTNDIVGAQIVDPTTDYITSQLWVDRTGSLWTVIIDTNGIFVPDNSGFGIALNSEVWSNGVGLVVQTIDTNGIFQFK